MWLWGWLHVCGYLSALPSLVMGVVLSFMDGKPCSNFYPQEVERYLVLWLIQGSKLRFKGFAQTVAVTKVAESIWQNMDILQTPLSVILYKQYVLQWFEKGMGNNFCLYSMQFILQRGMCAEDMFSLSNSNVARWVCACVWERFLCVYVSTCTYHRSSHWFVSFYSPVF